MFFHVYRDEVITVFSVAAPHVRTIDDMVKIVNPRSTGPPPQGRSQGHTLRLILNFLMVTPLIFAFLVQN